MTARFPRRSDIRTQAGMLGACLALIYGFTVATPGMRDRAGHVKGTDFIQFYRLGLAALHEPTALYDATALSSLSVAAVPEASEVVYLPVYGPQVSLLFAPLARLSYVSALMVWLSITVVIYGLCCAAVWRVCPSLRDERGTIAMVAAAFPAFFNLVAHGQNSAIALACFTGAFFALRRDYRVLAGLAIGTLAYKPQLGLAAACVFLLNREWRLVAGALIAASAQIGLAWWVYGTGVMDAYWTTLRGLGGIQPYLDEPFQMHSLLPFWTFLVPWAGLAKGLYLASAAAIIIVAWRVWRSPAPLPVRYACLLLASVLVNPHMYVYDLVILAPAFILITDWTLRNPRDVLAKPMQQALYFSYALPLFGVTAPFTHVQPSVVAMCALSGMLGVVARRRRIGDTAPVFTATGSTASTHN
jgi:hypothetical protein